MNRYIKLGYEGIELELPVHALYLYRDSEQLISNIIPLISEGIERKEKCIYFGNAAARALKRKFKEKVVIADANIGAPDLLPWLKNEYSKVSKSYQGMRVFLDCSAEFINYEEMIDDLSTNPDLKMFLLCQYRIQDINSEDLLEVLHNHPYVFVEHLLKPNCFYSRVKHRIWLDPLTGIFNRRYFENQLSKELQRASRYEHNLTVLFIDIDHFKRVNDEFGHQFGDQVLIELSQIIERSLRSVDVIARYGGDEFVILLPETRKEAAQKTALRLLTAVRNHDFFKGNMKVKDLGVSIGIAAFPEDAGGTYEMIRKADVALYQAKKKGGSQAVAVT